MSRAAEISSLSNLDTAALATAAATAEARGDAAGLIAVGGEFERREIFGEAWRLLALGSELAKPPELKLWDGKSHPRETLLVRRKIRHLGAELRMSRFIVPARKLAKHVIVAAEQRLVRLLSRTYAEVEVVPLGSPRMAEATMEASYERLAWFDGATAAEISALFRPLRLSAHSDARNGTIGLSWYSSNSRKPLPTLEDWCQALGDSRLRFASLQYGEQEAGLETLGAALRNGLIPSAPVDQMVDVDGFCEQVAAVAGVLTISNTTAHVAGMLGVPCVVLLDDFQHLTWPGNADRSAFYPNLRTLRQGGRRWTDVISDGLRRLNELIDERAPA